jgi:hypothetical protein
LTKASSVETVLRANRTQGTPNTKATTRARTPTPISNLRRRPGCCAVGFDAESLCDLTSAAFAVADTSTELGSLLCWIVSVDIGVSLLMLFPRKRIILIVSTERRKVVRYPHPPSAISN